MGGEVRHEADRHPDGGRRHPGAQRHDRRGRPARPTSSASRSSGSSRGSAACSTPRSRTSTSTRSSRRSPSSTRRGAGRSWAPRATTSTRDDTETIARVAERLARLKIDGLICVGGDGTLNGMQPLSHHLPVGPRPQDDRQRPRAELPRRAERVDPRARPDNPKGLRLQEAARPRLRPRRDGQLRDPRLRHRGLRLVAQRPADPDHGREPPPDRDHRGHGPRLRDDRAGDRLRPARHHPRARGRPSTPTPWSSASWRSSTSRSTPCSASPRGSSTLDGQILGAVTASKDPAGNVQYTGGRRGGQAAAGRADRRRLLHPQAPQRERRRRHLRPEGRPHPARGPADPLRPVLRLATRRQGGRPAAPGVPQLRGDPPVPRRRLRPRQHRRQQAPRPLGHDPRPAPLAVASTTRSGSSPRPRGSSTCGASSPTPSGSRTSRRSAPSSTPATSPIPTTR